jgi:hypothetical protein
MTRKRRDQTTILTKGRRSSQARALPAAQSAKTVNVAGGPIINKLSETKSVHSTTVSEALLSATHPRDIRALIDHQKSACEVHY